MKTPATNFEALLGQARDCGLTLEFATAYEINVALDEADCCGGGGASGDFGYISSLLISVPNKEPLPELYYQLFKDVRALSIRGNVNSIAFKEGNLTLVYTTNEAFSYCSSLSSITFSEGALTNVKNMYSTFAHCKSLTSITFPQGSLTQATSLHFAFQFCSSLTSVTFPEGALTQVKVLASIFANCKSLPSVTFPEGALTLVNSMYGAFFDCSTLTSITFPDGALTLATSLGNTFSYCRALQDLTIYDLPNINLSNTGFTYCTSLTLSSLQNIVNALPITTSGYKCTIGTTNLAKLSDTDIQIATDKGWTLN